MAKKVEITRTELSPKQLRRIASGTRHKRQMRRLRAIADVMEGAPRGKAATRNGMDPQTISDWIRRYNDEGPEGLKDRPRKAGGPKPSLTPEQLERLKAKVLAGPGPKDRLVRWRRRDLKNWLAEEEGVHLHERTVGKYLSKLGFSWMKPRPRHPKADLEAQEEFKKNSMQKLRR